MHFKSATGYAQTCPIWDEGVCFFADAKVCRLENNESSLSNEDSTCKEDVLL